MTTKADLQRLLEDPSPEGLPAAMRALDSSDRNLRVLALRVLRRIGGKGAVPGILRGLSDPKRRVRHVAARCSAAFGGHAEVAARLREIVEDETEKLKIRRDAVAALAQTPVEESEVGVLKELMQADKFRASVLLWLLQAELSEGVEELLREFVSGGSKQEAVMATRALCGYRIVNLGNIDTPRKRELVSDAEPAAGRVLYWVKREKLGESAWLSHRARPSEQLAGLRSSTVVR